MFTDNKRFRGFGRCDIGTMEDMQWTAQWAIADDAAGVTPPRTPYPTQRLITQHTAGGLAQNLTRIVCGTLALGAQDDLR